MESSILKSTKKLLNLKEDYLAFDLDVIMFINSAFSSLSELGVGSDPMMVVTGDEETWEQLNLDDDALSLVKIYIYLKVRMLFDPPATSFLIASVEKLISEHEWRLVTFHDSTVEATYAQPPVEEEVV